MNQYRQICIYALILVVGLWLGGMGQHAFTAQTAFSQPVGDAKVAIQAPEKAVVGQLVILDVSASEAASYSWSVMPATANFLVIDDGKRAVFSHGEAGEFTFVVAAAKDNTVDVKTHKIRIVAPGEVDASMTTAEKVEQWCETIDYESKNRDAISLAQSFVSVAVILADDATPADIVAATAKSNREALKENAELWKPFFVGLQAELKARDQAGLLPDAESHRAFWQEVAAALKQYAQTPE